MGSLQYSSSSLLHCCNGISIAALAAVFKREEDCTQGHHYGNLKMRWTVTGLLSYNRSCKSNLCGVKKERTQKMKRGNKSSYIPMSNY